MQFSQTVKVALAVFLLVAFGLLCSISSIVAYNTFNPKSCVIEFRHEYSKLKRPNETHRWTGEKMENT